MIPGDDSGSNMNGSYPANTTIQHIQSFQNKILRAMTKSCIYTRNSVTHDSLNINSIRSEILKLAEYFYNNIHSAPSEEIFNLPDYDFRRHTKRLKSTLAISPVLHYNDLRP